MEVVPDLAEARTLGQAAGVERLERVCADAATALRGAARKRPMPTAQHAYFGTLTPYIALRLLSAHTRHHGRALAASRLAAAADTLPVDGAVPMLRP